MRRLHERDFFRGLEHEGIAAGDGEREHPHRHHRREVERGDAGAHANRLQHGMAIHASTDVLGMLALEQMRRADGELDHLDAALHRTGSVFQCFAVLFTGELSQFGAMDFKQIAEFVQDTAAAQRRGFAPGRKGCLGGLHRIDYVIAAGQWHLPDHLAGSRVGYVGQAAAAAFGALAIDP